MAAETEPTETDVTASLSGLVKLAIDLRLILLLFAMAAALLEGAERGVLGLMLLASYAGVGVLLWWDRLAAVLVRQPWLFLGDMAITVGILVVTGIDGPFVLYTISTGFLAGVLYGYTGGALFGVGLASTHVLVASHIAAPSGSFVALIGIPVLIVVAGTGAASLRNLLLQAAKTRADLEQVVVQAAAAEERARLAREMHDTLGKTLYGISMSAAALPQWLLKQPDQASDRAREVAAAAETAAKEARQLISDLRSDEVDMPLSTAIVQWCREWSASSRIDVSCSVSQVDVLSASVRYELFTILREALRNVEAHAGASKVSLYLAQDTPNVVLEVVDDGVGLASTDLEQLAADGHYGLAGMYERAVRVGGELTLDSQGPGTTLRVVVPMESCAVRPSLAGQGRT